MLISRRLSCNQIQVLSVLQVFMNFKIVTTRKLSLKHLNSMHQQNILLFSFNQKLILVHLIDALGGKRCSPGASRTLKQLEHRQETDETLGKAMYHREEGVCIII